MRILVKELSAQRLFIGWTGEKNHVEFAFDFSAIFAEYPNADAYMSIKPPVGDIYPHTLNREGNLIVWDIYESDCTVAGDGVYQITFEQNETVVKSFIGYYTVRQSLVAEGEAPEPVEEWISDAQAALFALTGLTARAESLPAGSSATAEIVEVDGHKEILLGIPRGDQGVPGEPGEPGTDGISPVVSISTITGGHRITITDADGAKTFDVMDGEKGEDGFSPQITVTNITGGHRVSVTDSDGTKSFDVMDGVNGKDGKDGTDGQDGETPDFSIGVVQTLPAGSPATVTITGTKEAPVLNMGIPQGAKGEPGEIPQETLDQIESDISDLNSALKDKADIIVSSASGVIASFPDGAESTAKELVVGIEPVQSGTGDPSPSNVRPITGWTGANVSRTGKNLFDKTATGNVLDFYIDTSGRTRNAVSGEKSIISGLLPAGEYTISKISSSRFRIAWFDSVPSHLTQSVGFVSPTTMTVTEYSITLSKPCYIVVFCYNGSSENVTIQQIVDSFQIELGSTASSYESYQGQSLSISFPSSAGTVYGGTLTVNEDGSGILVVDRAIDIVDGTQSLNENGNLSYGGIQVIYTPSADKKRGSSNSNQNIGLLSDRFSATDPAPQYAYCITGRAVNGNIYINMPADVTTAVQARAWFSENNTQISYLLATPIEYNLTDVEVLELLKGQNNVWADTGNTSVTYRADTKLYIDNKITQAIANALNS